MRDLEQRLSNGHDSLARPAARLGRPWCESIASLTAMRLGIHRFARHPQAADPHLTLADLPGSSTGSSCAHRANLQHRHL